MLSADPDPFSQRYKPFSYSISSHTYCVYFGCECVCAQDEFRLFSLYRRPGNLSAPRSSSQQQRASQRPDQSEHTGLTGRVGTGAPTSRLEQRVNTHTLQRCCMRNQCEFGKLHNLNLLNNMISRNGHDMGLLK